MATADKNFSLLIALKLAIILLLSVTGVDLSAADGSSVQPYIYASGSEYSSQVLMAYTTHTNEQGLPELPEAPISKEEGEDDNNTEEKSGEKHLSYFDGQSFIPTRLAVSIASSYYQVFAYTKLFIPLYVLFHSWKSFLF
ncbi:hypothetical protein C900_00112 [Fulvivirga imtechensis AK7]|uniref:Uncharacterized protein n=1 Tax=Fulvivirga imtechensis AK7 TaxID=1237149 RepID=L8K0N2_9BACT|nr:hypothetical protein [Fulvivirga imtechensis]ELR73032.1 hypothetical protein C900_00112 [Fulvivirga imtechensis AK7]